MNKKITIIGGGSSTFVPQLMRLFANSKPLRGSTIVLMDIDERRLEIMDRLCRTLVENEGLDLTITSTTDQRQSLTGTDFCITAISVGGMDAWEKDIEVPAKYGVYMTIGDSVGPGGIMRALRHIPVLAGVADDMAQVAPQAWLFNYSNPVSSIITALKRHRPEIKSVGLCSCPSITRNARYLAEWAKVDPSRLVLPAPAAGLNHCAFMLDVRMTDGRSAFPLILAHTESAVQRWMLETYGVLPYCWSHVTEFFPMLSHLAEPYQGKLQGREMQYGLHVHDMEHERARMDRWQQLVQSWNTGQHENVSLDVLPSAEAIEVVEIIEALLTNSKTLFGLNVPNRGAISNLPDDAIVEVTSLVDGYGVRPVHVGALPEPIAATLRSHVAAQQLTAQAALTGSYETALQAFVQDPQTQARLDLDGIKALLKELMDAHRAYLPQFA
jgi:alpha-galactosidase/6-phospho-beta-glucosidase family protein